MTVTLPGDASCLIKSARRGQSQTLISLGLYFRAPARLSRGREMGGNLPDTSAEKILKAFKASADHQSLPLIQGQMETHERGHVDKNSCPDHVKTGDTSRFVLPYPVNTPLHLCP